MNNYDIINRTTHYVKKILKNAESGHDWFHVQRVLNNAQYIAKQEANGADGLIISLGALLHDIADSKFYNGDESIGPKKAREFLTDLTIEEDVIFHVEQIIKYISFKNTLDPRLKSFSSIELDIIQDADRLDAIGAIGIARAFNYGGFKNMPIYNPEIAVETHLSKESYKKSKAPTINHFYEKLLLLKGLMNTTTGKQMAEERHQFMLKFLDQFYREVSSWE